MSTKINACAAIAMLSVAFSAAPAWAHAKLLSSSPAANSTLSSMPAEIVLTFNESVQALTYKLVDKTGQELATGLAKADGKTLHFPVAVKPRSGTYDFAYKVAGDDSHVVFGEVVFSIKPQ